MTDDSFDRTLLTWTLVYPHRAGRDPLDQTAFRLPDQDVGYTRALRPVILFQMGKTAANDGSRPTTSLMCNGMVVLNRNHQRIPDWPELPATLSTELSGQDIEYYRRMNLQIDYVDLIGKLIDLHSCSLSGHDRLTAPFRSYAC